MIGIAAFTGCTTKLTVVPVSLPLAPDAMQIFEGAHPLEIINAQDSREAVIIRPKSSGYEYYGVMHDWTQAVVDLLQCELTKRNVALVAHASKKMMLRVVDVKLYFGSFDDSFPIRVKLKLEVKCQSALPKIVEGSYSAVELDHAAGGAVTNAVAAILRDSTLTDFIKQ